MYYNPLRPVEWVALLPALEAVAPTCWAVPPVGGDVEACTGARVGPPALPPVTGAVGR
jgi:hypothetical protein